MDRSQQARVEAQSTAASESTFKKSNICGVSNTRLYVTLRHPLGVAEPSAIANADSFGIGCRVNQKCPQNHR